jgi:hypothetical protein
VRWRAAAAALAFAGLAGAPQAAEEPAGWQFEFTPYLFASSLSGRTGASGVQADVDMSFGDIVDHLDAGFMATFEARKGKWGFGVDAVYFKLEDQRSRSWQGPLGIGTATGELQATMTEQITQLFVTHRSFYRVGTLDVVAGARYTQLDTDLDLVTTTGGLLPGGARALSAGKSWWDVVIGARGKLRFAERWDLVTYADVGAGGSELTWQALLGLEWQASKTLAVKGGYRFFYQDYEDDGFVWDMAAQGLYLGLGIGF